MSNTSNKQLDECRVRILSTISHEIRTPMNAIIGFSEQLKKTGLSKNQEEYVDIILNNSNQLLYMLNDIVDSSKMRFGHLSLVYEVVSLQSLIKNIEKKYAVVAEQNSLDFSIDKSACSVHYIRIDVKRVEKVLHHLLDNAFKFTKKGFVRLSIKSEMIYESVCNLHFDVIDSGVGISEEKLEHIFDLFTQEDSSDTREFGGVGIGLSMSYELAKMMDASLSVKSQKLQGSTFTFSLQNIECFSYDKALQSKNLHQKKLHTLEDVVPSYLDLEFSQEAQLQLHRFITELQKQLLDEYNAIVDKQNFDSYESWAKRLLALAKKYKNNVFERYSEALLDVLAKFDVENLTKILKDFTLLHARLGDK